VRTYRNSTPAIAPEISASHIVFALKLELWMGHEAAPVLDRVDGEDDVVHLSAK
jgi:hypothetical protein